MFLPSPQPSSQAIGQYEYIIACLAIFPSKVNSQVHCPKSCPPGGFPFTTVLWRCPREGCSAAAVHLGAVSAYCAEPSVSQAQTSLPLPADPEESPRGQGREGRAAGVGTVGIWATSSCDLLVPAGPARVWSCVHHLHLTLGCCCACPHYGLVGRIKITPFHDGQLRSHGNLVAHSQVSAKAQQQTNSCFSEGR